MYYIVIVLYHSGEAKTCFCAESYVLWWHFWVQSWGSVCGWLGGKAVTLANLPFLVRTKSFFSIGHLQSDVSQYDTLKIMWIEGQLQNYEDVGAFVTKRLWLWATPHGSLEVGTVQGSSSLPHAPEAETEPQRHGGGHSFLASHSQLFRQILFILGLVSRHVAVKI